MKVLRRITYQEYQAVQEEINALEKNDTWMLMKLLSGKHAIDSKWILKEKEMNLEK